VVCEEGKKGGANRNDAFHTGLLEIIVELEGRVFVVARQLLL